MVERYAKMREGEGLVPKEASGEERKLDHGSDEPLAANPAGAPRPHPRGPLPLGETRQDVEEEARRGCLWRRRSDGRAEGHRASAVCRRGGARRPCCSPEQARSSSKTCPRLVIAGVVAL